MHGGNPYSDEPSAFPDDPAYARMGANWRDTTTVYGPVFTLGSEGHAAVVGDSPGAAAWVYKGLGALAMLALTALAAFLGRDRAFAAAFVGWNPLLAVHFAGGGHNDAWMMALVLGALALGAVGKRHWAGAAWVGAIAIKWVAVVFLPLRALEARAQGRRVGHIGFAAAAVIVAALASWRYGTGWLEAFGPLAKNLREGAHYSLPSRLSSLGIPHDAAVGHLHRPFRPGLPLASAAGVARARPARALRRPPASDDAMAHRLVRRVGGAARRRGGGPGRPPPRSRSLRVPARERGAPIAFRP